MSCADGPSPVVPPAPRSVVESTRWLLDALPLRERRHVHLLGGGGKTTLLFAAAHALADEGRSVVTTTTTRILWPEPAQSAEVVVGSDLGSLLEPLRAALACCRHATALASAAPVGQKAGGLPVAVVEALVDAGVADHVLVEADGAAGRPLKAHADHEPVLSPRADLVVAVVGLRCLGAPVDDAHVHRAALLRERLGLAPGAVVTAGDVARAVLGPGGYLARVAPATEVAVLVTGAATPSALEQARRLGETLLGADREGRLGRVVVGDLFAGVLERVG